MLHLSLRIRASLVLLLLLASVVTLLVKADQGPLFEANFLTLLPQQQQGKLPSATLAAAQHQVNKQLGNQVIFLIGQPDLKQAQQAASTLSSLLQQAPQIAKVNLTINTEQQRQLGQFYFPLRSYLLSPAQQQAINVDSGQQVAQQALVALYGPMAATNSQLLQQDPFFLFATSLSQLLPKPNQGQLAQGYISFHYQGLHYVLVTAHTHSDHFSLQQQASLSEYIDDILQQVEQTYSVTTLKSGALFYSQAGANSAKTEISSIGLGSLLGVILLVLICFRSITPLILTFSAIACGCLVALATTVLVFGQIHLFTLVIGASLIGVSVDYSFHYLVEAQQKQPLQRVYHGITAGLCTSVTAYLTMALAPFPGLQQLAVFASSGLIFCYLFVLGIFPLIKWQHRPPTLGMHYLPWLLKPAQRLSQRTTLVSAALLLACSAWLLTSNDDIRQLQQLPAELTAQEKQIKTITQQQLESYYLLIQGQSEADLLTLNQVVSVQLDKLKQQQTLDGYQSISQWVPSPNQQQQSHLAWQQLINHQLSLYLTQLGMTQAEQNKITQTLMTSPAPLTLTQWLASPVSEQFGWLALPQQHASLVIISGVKDKARLQQLVDSLPKVELVDQRAQLSALFKQYRQLMTLLLVLAYGIILLALWGYFGRQVATKIILAPILAALSSLAVLALTGQAINLFHVIALILVLGIGIDYTLFFAAQQGILIPKRQQEKMKPMSNKQRNIYPTHLAITLSALTTILSFGLLALSDTYAIASFGTTVLIGIIAAYGFAPIALQPWRSAEEQS
ncbi:MMPL family transporter [Motilimonas sp. 1_MG-2023]|uniref:MMPL family transporter n=1 Tax=Motilimonas sp. 1_MG-2023 TaxID=3062672 RepID=UPI0026E2A430|nr:MMPL family transporter [Motilimonas sp. 1_MG-2023]MDO6527098.1 MMPL family transporter [Motilimonas sp. 1_MG-2023]